MLNLKKFNSNFIAVTLLLIIIILLMKMCGDANTKKQFNNTIEQLLKDKGELQTTIDDMGRQTAKQNVVVIPQNAGDKIKDNESIDKLETKTIFRTVTRHDTIKINLVDTFVVEQLDTVWLKTFKYDDGWVKFAGKTDADSLFMDSLIVSNAYTIETGMERKWLLGKENQVIYIRNDNPHTSTTDITSFKLPDEKKWYEKDGLKYFVGALGMFLILR